MLLDATMTNDDDDDYVTCNLSGSGNNFFPAQSLYILHSERFKTSSSHEVINCK